MTSPPKRNSRLTLLQSLLALAERMVHRLQHLVERIPEVGRSVEDLVVERPSISSAQRACVRVDVADELSHRAS